MGQEPQAQSYRSGDLSESALSQLLYSLPYSPVAALIQF